MVPGVGLEPTMNRVWTERSTNWTTQAYNHFHSIIFLNNPEENLVSGKSKKRVAGYCTVRIGINTSKQEQCRQSSLKG